MFPSVLTHHTLIALICRRLDDILDFSKIEAGKLELDRQACAQVQVGASFDVAVLDMQMPDMDGLTLAKQIHRNLDGQMLPLVMLTSLGRREVDTRGIEFAAFLNKPIKPSQLYNTLISLCADQEHTQPLLRRAEVADSQFDAMLGERLSLRILLAEDNTVNQR